MFSLHVMPSTICLIIGSLLSFCHQVAIYFATNCFWLKFIVVLWKREQNILFCLKFFSSMVPCFLPNKNLTASCSSFYFWHPLLILCPLFTYFSYWPHYSLNNQPHFDFKSYALASPSNWKKLSLNFYMIHFLFAFLSLFYCQLLIEACPGYCS